MMTNVFYQELVTMCRQLNRKLKFRYQSFNEIAISPNLLRDNVDCVDFINRFDSDPEPDDESDDHTDSDDSDYGLWT